MGLNEEDLPRIQCIYDFPGWNGILIHLRMKNHGQRGDGVEWSWEVRLPFAKKESARVKLWPMTNA